MPAPVQTLRTSMHRFLDLSRELDLVPKPFKSSPGPGPSINFCLQFRLMNLLAGQRGPIFRYGSSGPSVTWRVQVGLFPRPNLPQNGFTKVNQLWASDFLEYAIETAPGEDMPWPN